MSFITLEIRVLFSEQHNLSAEPTDLEFALQTLNWSIATTVLMWWEIKNNDNLIRGIRRLMSAITLIALLIGGGFASNVFFQKVDIGPLIIFNLQFLQFLIPACLYAAKAYMAYCAGRKRSLKIYGIFAFVVFWFWISVEIHHAYYPNGGYSDPISDWEGYMYSLFWLLYAVVILTLGLYVRIDKIRMAGLGMLAIVVLKVFIIDMSTLEGLARALSFMGLGTALIGIGYLYQRIKVIDNSIPVVNE